MFELKEDMAKWRQNGEAKECLQMEWVNFHKMFVKIMGQLDKKLEAFEKGTLVRYFPKHGEKVYHFHEAAVDFPDTKI